MLSVCRRTDPAPWPDSSVAATAYKGEWTPWRWSPPSPRRASSSSSLRCSDGHCKYNVFRTNKFVLPRQSMQDIVWQYGDKQRDRSKVNVLIYICHGIFIYLYVIQMHSLCIILKNKSIASAPWFKLLPPLVWIPPTRSPLDWKRSRKTSYIQHANQHVTFLKLHFPTHNTWFIPGPGVLQNETIADDKLHQCVHL